MKICKNVPLDSKYFVIHYPPLLQGLNHSSTDVRITACDVCSSLTKKPDLVLSSITPRLLANTQEKNTGVKAAAESAILQLFGDDQELRVSIYIDWFWGGL